MLKIKGMARSTYYYSIKHQKDKYEAIRLLIKEIYETNERRYGSRRVCLQMRQKGIVVNHKVVARLMHDMGLFACKTKRNYHSYKGEIGKVAPNILQRNFAANGPNQKWATDVTQMNVNGHKCFLSPLLDMWNGEIISYAISDSPNLDMVLQMLRSAFKQHPDVPGLLIHSDQGWHYQHTAYQYLLKKYGVMQSMSRKGNCLDNAMMENFFGLMKKELLYTHTFNNLIEFKQALVEYIQYYNNYRIKLRLKMSPVDYRKSSKYLIN